MRDMLLIVFAVVLVIGVLNYSNDKEKEESPIIKKKDAENGIMFSHGVIVDKVFDTRTGAKALVYKNHENNVFSISKNKLFGQAQIGDSVKVGYSERKIFDRIQVEFITIEVLGKAKNLEKDFRVITSETPPVIHTTSYYGF